MVRSDSLFAGNKPWKIFDSTSPIQQALTLHLYLFFFVMARPSRSNAYTHPAKVLLEGKIKLQTPAEKRAHDAAAAEKNWSEAARVEKEHEDGIKCIAAMEDSLKRDDRNYGKDAPPYRPQADASTHKAKGYYSVAKGQVALQVSQT